MGPLKMRSLLRDFKTRTLALILLGSILIFIPLALVLKTFTENAADELINNWLQSEFVSLQQGQVLQPVLKLERSIKDSSLIQSVVVLNEKKHPLIEIGKSTTISPEIKSSQTLSIEQGSWLNPNTIGKRIYHLKINHLTLFIVTGNPVLMYLAFGMIVYMLLVLATFYQVLKRQWIQEEKQKSEQIVQELRLKNDYEQKLSQLGKQFAHDIRSPLSALKMIYQDLEKEMKSNLSSKLNDNVTLVPDIIFRLESISEKVLSSKAQDNDEDKKNHFKISKENIVELTERVVAEKTIELSGKFQIHFQIVASEKKILVEIDRIEFMRALSNLINNAVEASAHLKSFSIKVELKKELDDTLTLIVEDQGKGLTQEMIDYLKVQNGTIGKEGGHGLGLLHLKEFLRHHHGSFDIESQLGIKTAITIKLPRLPEDYIHMVHIDDENFVRLLWKKKAREQGLTLLSLSDPQEIFQFLDHLNPKKTHIYCDLFFHSSQESGISTLKRLKELGHENLYLASGLTLQDEINKEHCFINIGKMFPETQRGKLL